MLVRTKMSNWAPEIFCQCSQCLKALQKVGKKVSKLISFWYWKLRQTEYGTFFFEVFSKAFCKALKEMFICLPLLISTFPKILLPTPLKIARMGTGSASEKVKSFSF